MVGPSWGPRVGERLIATELLSRPRRRRFEQNSARCGTSAASGRLFRGLLGQGWRWEAVTRQETETAEERSAEGDPRRNKNTIASGDLGNSNPSTTKTATLSEGNADDWCTDSDCGQSRRVLSQERFEGNNPVGHAANTGRRDGAIGAASRRRGSLERADN